ncbi:HlyD family type I secretion periplasmic adaptor subunit [Salmonella enterica]|nr:HlyD family type I secretion periplasmic adaptor subunit [Salmonella enterica]EKR4575159.1 HlyD family type I secretion periplasmic adaptor subunit [Salmonella enterica]
MYRYVSNTHYKNNQCDEQHYIRFGWFVIGIGLFGFLIWATFAPLDRGVTASGLVTVSGNHKTIQAPANGIIKSILVKDGDYVKAGSVLVQLRAEQIQAQVNSLKEQYYSVLAEEYRLLAERDNLNTINFPSFFHDANNRNRINVIFALQNDLFSSRKLTLQREIDIHRQSIEGIRSQLKGLMDSRINKKIQLTSLQERMNNMKKLAGDGYLPRNNYLEIRNQFAELSSNIDEATGKIGQLQKQLQEIEQRIEQRLASYQQEVRAQLAKIRIEENELRTKLEAAKFDLENMTILSPVDGKVVGVNIFTLGGVIRTGDNLMNILPDNEDLIVDSKLKVELIDKVYEGLSVDLMFTAFNQNKTPKIQGTITMVSADRLIDKNNGEPYYHLQITVSKKDMEKLHGKDVKPGMPVEVFVKMGTRSLLSYLFKPVLDRAYTSLTEE